MWRWNFLKSEISLGLICCLSQVHRTKEASKKAENVKQNVERREPAGREIKRAYYLSACTLSRRTVHKTWQAACLMRILLMLAAPASSPVRSLLAMENSVTKQTLSVAAHNHLLSVPLLETTLEDCASLFPSLPFYHPPSTHHNCECLQKSSLLTGFLTRVEKVPIHRAKLSSRG